MSVMIFESEALVKFVSANVEVIGLEMHSLNSQIATQRHSKLDCALANSLGTVLWNNIELVDQTIAAVEFERKAKAEDHVSD